MMCCSNSVLSDISDIATGISAILSIALLFVYIIQVNAMKNQIEIMKEQRDDDKEKTISDTTLNVLLAWTNNLNSDMTRSRKIVERLSKEQCIKLYKCERFKVTSDIYIDICIRMKRDIPKDNKEYILSTRQINTLRDDCIKYLNLLETVFISRQLKTVSSDIIEKQFRYLVTTEDQDSVLYNFRIAAGGKNCYPAIDAFCNKILNEGKKHND